MRKLFKGKVEIHTFDHTMNYNDEQLETISMNYTYVNFHQIGLKRRVKRLKSSNNVKDSTINFSEDKSLLRRSLAETSGFSREVFDKNELGPTMQIDDIRDLLSHKDRTIDILKIDCENCEWELEMFFAEDFQSREEKSWPRVLLLELHKSPARANTIFENLMKVGYVIYHKEPNTMGCKGDCIEYSFLKMHPDFCSAVNK